MKPGPRSGHGASATGDAQGWPSTEAPGTTPMMRRKVSAGAHTIELRNPVSGRSARRKIVVRSGRTELVDVELSR